MRWEQHMGWLKPGRGRHVKGPKGTRGQAESQRGEAEQPAFYSQWVGTAAASGTWAPLRATACSHDLLPRLQVTPRWTESTSECEGRLREDWGSRRGHPCPSLSLAPGAHRT